MICYEVYLNGVRECVAGTDYSGMLDATIQCEPYRPSETNQFKNDKNATDLVEMTLHVGGLRNTSEGSGEKEHVAWTNRALALGDEIKIKITDQSTFDAPQSIKQSNSTSELELKKRFVRLYAQELGWKVIENSTAS